MKGLVVADKRQRVANFHKHTIESFVELIAAAGLDHPSKVNRSHIYRRISPNQIRTYEEIFPVVPLNSYVTVPVEAGLQANPS